MPSNWLYVDTNFPAFTGAESTEEKVTAIQNYMYMLVEQLRYSMHNLDLSNMNRTAVQQFSGTITEPVYARIKDTEGSLAQLALTAEALTASVADMESGLSQTLRIGADGVTITNADGSMVTIDGGQIRADTLELTGRITFSDLDDRAQGSINGAYSAASSAGSLARSIINGTASGTFISGQAIYSPTIYSSLLEIVAGSEAGGMLMKAEHFGRIYDMLEISYVHGNSPYVDITSPAGAVIRFNFGDHADGIEFYGNVDFSGANVTGL